MGLDIENYFKHFIRNFGNGINKEELSKIVDKNIISIVENFLKMASHKLQRIFPDKVFYGLCLHVDSSIKRLRNNKKIVNYNLKNIKENNKEEFALSKELVTILEKTYNINASEDEIGYISMFLSVDETGCKCVEDRPIVVIAMQIGCCTPAPDHNQQIKILPGPNHLFHGPDNACRSIGALHKGREKGQFKSIGG